MVLLGKSLVKSLVNARNFNVFKSEHSYAFMKSYYGMTHQILSKSRYLALINKQD